MKNALIVSILISSVNAFASDSLWGQMESGKFEPLNGRVVKIQDGVDSASVDLEVKDADGQRRVRTLPICNSYDPSQTETERAAFMSRRLEVLRQAQKSDDRVQAAVKGPWQPCLQSVELAPSTGPAQKL